MIKTSADPASAADPAGAARNAVRFEHVDVIFGRGRC